MINMQGFRDSDWVNGMDFSFQEGNTITLLQTDS